jgi:hypothetical protein
MRYSEIVRIPTSTLTLNSSEIVIRPGEIIDVPKLETRIANDTTNVTYLVLDRIREYAPFLLFRPVSRIFWILIAIPRYLVGFSLFFDRSSLRHGIVKFSRIHPNWRKVGVFEFIFRLLESECRYVSWSIEGVDFNKRTRHFIKEHRGGQLIRK